MGLFGFFFRLNLVTIIGIKDTQIKDRRSKDQHSKDKDTAKYNTETTTRQQKKQLINHQSHRQLTKHQIKVFNNERKHRRLKKSRTAHRTFATKLNNKDKTITDRTGQNVSEEELIRLEQISTLLTKNSCACQTRIRKFKT